MWRDGVVEYLEHDYWQNFQETYTANDLDHFIRQSVVTNRSLSRIFHFAFIPDIEADFENYPIKDKAKELSSIDEADYQNLYTLMNTESDLIGDHLEWMNQRFQVIGNTLRAAEQFSFIPLRQILNVISWHKIVRLKDEKSEKEIRIQGLYLPVFMVYWESVRHGKNIERVCHMDFQVSAGDLKEERNKWENDTLNKYQMFQMDPRKENLIFGGQGREIHRIRYYLKGQKLEFPLTEKGDFIYPTAQRYQGLIERKLRDAEKLGIFYFSKGDSGQEKGGNLEKGVGEIERETHLLRLEDALRQSILDYDCKKGYFAPFAQLNLRGLNTKIFRSKEFTTTAVEKPCNETMRDTWISCRHKRPIDRQFPECERRKNGFCTYPEAKRIHIEKLKNGPRRNGDREVEAVDEESEHKAYDEYITNFNGSMPDTPNLEECNPGEDVFDRLRGGIVDEIDRKIIECLESGKYFFRSGVNVINYSKISRKLGISYKTVQRRIKKIGERAKK